MTMPEMQMLPDDQRDLEEENLARGLSRGDDECVRDFLRRTHRQVYNMAARLAADPEQRHDWSQEILLAIVREMSAGRFVYRRPGCFWAWFQARVNFLLINLYHKDRKHSRRWTTGEVGDDLVSKVPLNEGADPLGMLEVLETRRVVDECLERLSSEDHRRALHLVLFQELPYQDIADEMGASLNTVRSWIRRARIAMRECVAGKLGFPATEDLN